MSKSNSNSDSCIFGNIFDLDGDGKTDCIETALMFAMFNEMTKDDERKNQTQMNRSINLDDMDIEGI